MQISISDEVKARIVRIGVLRAFTDKRQVINNDKERIAFFDQIWNGVLKSGLEEAVHNDLVVPSSVVKKRVRNQFKRAKNPEQFVDIEKEHYEFTKKVLFVAQLKELNGSDEYEMDQLWSFTYTEASSELFCFEFKSIEEKEKFEEFASRQGEDPKKLAREAILEKMQKEIDILNSRKESLEADLIQLEQEFRKSNIAFYHRMLRELKERLLGDYSETSGDDSWQTWIHANNWLFGTQYQHPIPKQRVGFGSIPDFLFPTLDGFVDILEIKKPNANLIREDKSHKYSYLWSAEIAQAIGQVVTYLYEIELHQLEIAKQINRFYSTEATRQFYVIKPRAFILAGRSVDWKSDEREAFRKLNYALNGIEILTYDDLVQKGESLIALYTREIR